MFFRLTDGTLINLDYVVAVIPESEENYAGIRFYDDTVARITSDDFQRLSGALFNKKMMVH